MGLNHLGMEPVKAAHSKKVSCHLLRPLGQTLIPGPQLPAWNARCCSRRLQGLLALTNHDSGHRPGLPRPGHPREWLAGGTGERPTSVTTGEWVQESSEQQLSAGLGEPWAKGDLSSSSDHPQIQADPHALPPTTISSCFPLNGITGKNMDTPGSVELCHFVHVWV